MFNNNNTEKQAVEQLAEISKELIKQNRSKTRWRRLMFLVVLTYIGIISYASFDTRTIDKLTQKEKPFIAEVILSGVIMDGGDIEADKTIELLTTAFSEKNSKAVILRLNSPGGSPVQSNRIYNGIKALKKQYKNKKFIVVIDDICASGCYFIASIADEIYADKSSIVGSIGVVMSGFGFVKTIEKLGVERRLYTAGKYKGFLDSFSKEDKFARQHIQKEILEKSHQNFINAVKEGRGNRLGNDENLFTGLVWLGDKAIELGLIDGIGDTKLVAKKLKIKTVVEYKVRKTLLEELMESSFKGITKATLEGFSQIKLQ
ncbi:Periplasmic serine proteases (ClpP class) [hydrothermal vent metagenome]|uniref:Periplasmic serine proteases (ClpP class) n=1 Tax=hydrothermal vent metagenome TaxID=652676 RepID=A0A1W1BQF2_9ZZZZ